MQKFQFMRNVKILKVGGIELSLAASRSTLRTVTKLWSRYSSPVDIYSRDNGGRPPLCCSTTKNLASIVEYLIEKDADLVIPAKDNRSPISWATVLNNSLLLCYLIVWSNTNSQGTYGGALFY